MDVDLDQQSFVKLRGYEVFILVKSEEVRLDISENFACPIKVNFLCFTDFYVYYLCCDFLAS